MPLTLQKDKNDNLIVYPVTELGITPVADMSIIVILEYAETPEALESGERKQIQAMLTAPMALDFAEELKKIASVLLAPLPSNISRQ